MVLIGVHAGYDTTRTATQVCLRGHEAGLGGHDAGVSGDDEGVEDVSILVSKRGRTTRSDCATFSVFVGHHSEFACDTQKYLD